MNFEEMLRLLELAFAICREGERSEPLKVEEVLKVAKKLERYIEKSADYDALPLLFPKKNPTEES
jgi:hypothetical protein